MSQNGAAIRAIRKAKGIRLRALARDVGVSAGYLCNVEADRRKASVGLVERIAKKLDEDVAAISRNPS